MEHSYLYKRMLVVWQYCYYPLFILGSIAVCVLLIKNIPSAYWFLIPSLMVAITLPLILLSEKLLPYRSTWQGSSKESFTDVIRTFVIFPLASLTVLYLLSVVKGLDFFYTAPLSYAEAPLLYIVANLGFFLVSDFCYYWMHRAFHRSRVLWGFHAIHHGANRVYSINSGKFHFLEAFLSSLVYFSPMLILGASEEAIVLATTLSLMTGFLEHANINFKAGVLNYVFNTAELHRWHHSIIVKESNSNFGKVLSVWDLCFGTFLFPGNREVKEVGIKAQRVPQSFVKQLVYPFRRSKG